MDVTCLLTRPKSRPRVLLLRLKVLDPRSAVKDADKMASDAVKKDLDALKKYQTATKDISAMLVREPIQSFFSVIFSFVLRRWRIMPPTYVVGLSNGLG